MFMGMYVFVGKPLHLLPAVITNEKTSKEKCDAMVCISNVTAPCSLLSDPRLLPCIIIDIVINYVHVQ